MVTLLVLVRLHRLAFSKFLVENLHLRMKVFLLLVSCYNEPMMRPSHTLRELVYDFRAALRASPAFGALLFGLLGTALLFSPFGGTYFEAIKYPWAVSVAGLYVGILASGQWRIPTTYNAVSLLLVVWSLIAAIWSPSIVVAIVGNFPRYNSSVLLFLFFVVVLWVAIGVVRQGKARWLVGALLGVSGFAALFAVLQSYGIASYTGIESFYSSVPDRVGSLLGNPNFSALFLAAALPFALVRAVQVQTRAGRVRMLFLVFIMCWSIALFASRGAILAACIGVLPIASWLLITQRWKNGALLVAGLCGCGLLFSGYFFLYRGEAATTLVTAQDASAVDRFVAWDMARDLLLHHPWLGYGPASFQQYYWEHLPSGLMAEGLYFDDAHNTLLHIASAIGFPGLLLFVLLIALAAGRAAQVLRERFRDQDAGVLVAAFGALAVWLVGSSFNPVTPALYMELALILAILYASGGAEQVAREVFIPRTARFSLRVLSVVLIVYGVCMIVGNQLFIVATRYHAKQDFVKSYHYTNIAAHIDPFSPLLKVARVATMQSAGISLDRVRGEIRNLLGRSWATSPRIVLQLADVAGQLFVASGDPQDAQIVQQALAIARAHGPTYPDAYVQSAYYLVSFGKPAEAVRYGQQGVLLQPKNYLTWLILGKAYQAAGNVHGMELALEKARVARPYDKLIPLLQKRLKETHDPQSINLLPQKTFVLLSLQ